MRVAITGASGFIGNALVDHLRPGHDLLLIGRNPVALSARYGNLDTAGFDDLAARLAGCDALVHLATANSDSDLPDNEIEAVNTGLAETVRAAASQAELPLIINAATATQRDTAYARSKAAAGQILDTVGATQVVHLRFAAVYGEAFRGRLSVLNRLLGVLRKPAFQLLSSLTPTLHISAACRAVEATLNGQNRDSRTVTDRQRRNWVYAGFKLAVDYGFALVVIVFFWWLLLILWVLIRAMSPGPGIFAQTRVGRWGKPFTCYKFRTMAEGTKQAATHEVGESAVTPLGAFLRKTKLDELPQVINMLRGELSLVGPRPCLPVQTELITERERRGVLSIMPGLTGLSQVKGIDMRDPEMLAKSDAEYAALRTIPLDLNLILATLTGRGFGDRVSRNPDASSSTGQA